MFRQHVLPPCEEETTIRIVWFGWVASRLITLSPWGFLLSEPQQWPEARKLPAPAVILRLSLPITVYL
ncbi:TPA: hypothetical protein GF715_12255, partial [Citrobacter rodentium NBRC 105723 = DSM 16636]|nr:hypothetical protein [Citrobacter rodentium NBRC 105723 = DSM 16636]HAT8018530.1 hypothetical protein [Citrobacter rodentium]HAT8028133.1 hypothetical protein [Citrobacter rodentium]HAT8033366.1 hypothetical protein [Citrobacter rodentium]HAT8038084.1 hypothetical protein [Citrobacter rodentium]